MKSISSKCILYKQIILLVYIVLIVNIINTRMIFNILMKFYGHIEAECNVISHLNSIMPSGYTYIQQQCGKTPKKPKTKKRPSRYSKKEESHSISSSSDTLDYDNDFIYDDITLTVRKLMYHKSLTSFVGEQVRQCIFKELNGIAMRSKSQEMNTIRFLDEFNSKCLEVIVNHTQMTDVEIEPLRNFLMSRTFNTLKTYAHCPVVIDKDKLYKADMLFEEITKIEKVLSAA